MASQSTTVVTVPAARVAAPGAPTARGAVPVARGAVPAARGAAPGAPTAQPAAAADGSSTVVPRATLRRRRLAVLVALLVLSTLLTVAIGRVGAQAELADPAAGHAVVAPGDTLWDVAVDTAPSGVDPREQLAAIQGLNGLDGSAVDPWTVVLLPAR